MRPTERLLQSPGGICWAGEQDLRCVNQQPWEQKKLASISPFQDYSIIPRTFIYAGVARISNKFPNKIQFISNKFQNYFKPNHKSHVENLQPKLCKSIPH